MAALARTVSGLSTAADRAAINARGASGVIRLHCRKIASLKALATSTVKLSDGR